MERKKILFIDLDGTLIRTASGKKEPEDITDFRIRYDVLNKIRSCCFSRIAIVTNQPKANEDFSAKIKALEFFLFIYCKTAVSSHWCTDNSNRKKPDTGMLDEVLASLPKNIRKRDLMLFVGTHDEETAENFGIDYMDVEDFV